ncbi:MAG: hypothetical protein PHD76_14895 [Methylacidiphilales bacterium]|nr:hypothetical protein [Candidatus Methylacidiphilales bacterium]
MVYCRIIQIPLQQLKKCRPALLLAFLLSSTAFSQTDNLLKNPGFENGLSAWSPNPADSTRLHVTEEAASMGKMGLRFGGDDSQDRLSLASEQFPIQAGHIYRLTFWGRMGGAKPNLMAKLMFADGVGKAILPVNMPGFWPVIEVKAGQAFNLYTAQATAPEGASTLSILLSFQSKSKDTTDVDDFALTEMTPEAAARTALPPPIPIEPLLAEIKANPTRGKSSPKIVLKLDDFAISWAKGPLNQVHHHWLRIEKFVEDRKIKVGIGVVAKGLETASPEVLEWMKKMHDSGLVEFWLHGYDHAPWTGPDGKEMPEGRGRSVEEEIQRETLCQKIAGEKLGFHFASYGPTGSGPQPLIDEAFLQSLQNDPYMKDIMYPWPIDEMGSQLMAKGKVTVLDRVFPVNIEAVVGHPRFDVFLQGYAHNRGRGYFILQGHPPLWGWDDTEKNETYGEFLKIVDFLKEQGAAFVTPEECAAAQNSTPPVAGSAPVIPEKTP